MPYVSDAQRRKFHADPKLRQYVAEYDAATSDRKLPARLHPRRRRRHHNYATAITRALAGH